MMMQGFSGILITWCRPIIRTNWHNRFLYFCDDSLKFLQTLLWVSAKDSISQTLPHRSNQRVHIRLICILVVFILPLFLDLLYDFSDKSSIRSRLAYPLSMIKIVFFRSNIFPTASMDFWHEPAR